MLSVRGFGSLEAARSLSFCNLHCKSDIHCFHSTVRVPNSYQPTIFTTMMKILAIATFSLSVALVAAEEEVVTPSPTTTTPHYDEELGCWAISVEHDATYCIDGPICSGSGATPAGTLCPVKGDVAIADCHSYLKSYAGDENCVLPVDATCQVIKTGAWGCVLSGSATPAPTKTCNGECIEPTPVVTPSATKTSVPNAKTPSPTKSPTPTSTTKTPSPTSTTKSPTPTSTTKTPTPTPTNTPTPCPGCTSPPHTSPPTPTPTHCTGHNCTSGSGSFSGNGSYVGNVTLKADAAPQTSSSDGVSAGLIGAIAAAAAVVAVVAGAAIYKQYTKKLNEEEAPMKVSTLSSFGLAATVLIASVAAYETPTPAPTATEPYYDEELGCWSISVEHDATYCIDGPICSGSGPSPAGSLCPVKGDTAIADCHTYLASYGEGDKCVLPVDATCQVIHTGAWGCVIPGSNPTPAPTNYGNPTPAPTNYGNPTPAPTNYGNPTPAPTKYGNGGGNGGHGGNGGGNGGHGGGNGGGHGGGNGGGNGGGSGSWAPGNGSAAGNETVTLSGTEAASAGGVSAGVIAAVAAAAAAVAAIAGVAIYRQHTKVREEEEEATTMPTMKTSTLAIATALLIGTASANNSTNSNTTTTSGCWDVSVEHDATYCIEGPICSGSGLEPTGSLCPSKGDVATADCHDYLTSFSDGSCVLPVDATCQVIKTGAWGCVLSSSSSSGSGVGTGEAGEGSGSAAVNATVLAAEGASGDSGASAGVIVAIAAAAGCVAAVAGFALYKQHQKHSAEAAERARLETFVDVVTP
ncbi:hypothetical protein P3T76_001791 [Phytophthora citrophthora]|uniref:Mucin-like protein n=1 Tax=Phytophthora citrophthora TaxID=4793 RepID=A0AAD9LQQ3_9STRA|nr:hypothetical protein P3T76_001791 [Phytophthora citrophthora]